MRGEPGTVCRLRATGHDGSWPVEGDFLRTRAGSCYRIDEVRPGRPGSKTLVTFVCTRLEPDAVEFGQDGVFMWTWNSRLRT